MGKQTEFQYDELQMFFGDDYKVSDYITIHQPTVGEIMEFGERRYYSMLTQLCAICKPFLPLDELLNVRLRCE